MTNLNLTLTRLAVSAVAVAVTAGLAAAPASAAAAPAERTTGEAQLTAPAENSRLQSNLIINRYGDDGVKGAIKNRTNHTIRVADPVPWAGCQSGVHVLIPPGGEVQYYDSKAIEFRHHYDLLLEGEGASLQFTRVGSVDTHFLALTDPYVGRPDTYFRSGGIKNLRKGWSEQTAHTENTPTASIHIKREKDGWRGDGWHADNDDWPVFTITVDKM